MATMHLRYNNHVCGYPDNAHMSLLDQRFRWFQIPFEPNKHNTVSHYACPEPSGKPRREKIRRTGHNATAMQSRQNVS